MKVLHVIPSMSSQYGGPARALIEMERALSELGVDVTTVTTDDGCNDKNLPVPRGVEIKSDYSFRYYFKRATRTYAFSPAMAFWLFKNARKYDVVHAHALFSFPPVAAALIARLSGVPFIVRPLGVLAKYGMTQRRAVLKRLSVWLVERRLIRSAAAVHFTSLEEQREAGEFGLAGRGVVIPLGLGNQDGERSTRVRNLPPGDKTILFLSRLDPKKNLEALIEAFALLCAKRSDLRLVIAGTGFDTYTDRLRNLAQSQNVAQFIEWTGHVEGNAKAKLFSEATVFCLPSFSENFGIAVAEALAQGLPVVVSSGVAIARNVVDAEAGIRTGIDAGSIAQGILEILDNEQTYRKMSAAATDLARREFSSDMLGRRLFELYHRIVQNGVTLPDYSN